RLSLPARRLREALDGGAGRIGRREVGALGGAGPEGSDGGDGQAEDLVLVAALRHHHRQDEEAVQVRDLVPQPDDVPLPHVHPSYAAPFVLGGGGTRPEFDLAGGCMTGRELAGSGARSSRGEGAG